MKSSNATKIRHAVWVLAGLILGGLFGEAGTSLAAELTWAQKADMPTARYCHSTSVVDGKIYVIGGVTSEPDSEVILAMEVYDPTTDSWTQKADIPTGLGYLSTAVVNGKIHAIAGRTLLSTAFEYDPVTDTWTRKADLPTSRWFHAASVVDGKIYVIGGASNADNPVGYSTVEVYDPVTDTWTSKANMPFGVWGLCTAVVDGKIYALGGRPGWTAVPYVQEYDPATDTWTRKSDMPVATSNMGSVVLGKNIVVIGGWLSSGNYPYTAVQMYDPETDIWTIEGDAPFLRAAFSASVVNNRIYAIGGTDRPHPCPATSTVYELTVSGPPPDLNGDGVVDIHDLVRLIESWGRDDPLCDIGPTAFGDSIVDAADLEVLMSYWGQEVLNPALVAQWTFDESEGDIAHDSTGTCDATLFNGPTWQPTGGQRDGALELDGLDDYIDTGFSLNPKQGPFSIYVWVKGGTAGEVILSQASQENWLLLDPHDGVLTTALRDPYIPSAPLLSETPVDDGNWHRVGLVWDGTYRTLCVDYVEVATDEEPVPVLFGAVEPLYIGAGANLEPGTFWTGLIDDVRICNQAVRP